MVFGLSGSGKSFLARIIKRELGFLWLRSDVIRKEMAGISPHTHAGADYGRGIYTEDMTRRVYEEMVRRAKEITLSGEKVVLDATFLKRWQRDLVRSSFEKPLFILARCGEEEILRRLRERIDVSDADERIYFRQKEEFEYPGDEEFIAVDTEKPERELAKILKDLIKDP